MLSCLSRCTFAMRGMSGCAPDSALTFFASPKKVSKERRADVRAAARFLALLGARGRLRNSPCGLKHLSRLIPSPLRCSALPQRRGEQS